ncbi:MAG: SH3 domain-containing protein [Bacteroidetes bacterium]|nr:SH3 domain-containing protein [Bacteroidota bacterium]
MRAVLFSLLCLLAAWPLAAAPSSATATLQAANNAYHEQDYATAIDRYEQLVQKGYESVALYHNLGNTYFRSQDYARAVLYYKRALRLAPRDKQLQQNLRLAQLELPGTVVNIRKSDVVTLWLSVQERLSTRAWSIIGLIILWMGMAGLALWQFGKNRQQRKMGFISGIVLLLLCLLPFGFAYGRAQQEFFRQEAVVMAEESLLRAAPESGSQEVQTVYKGDVVRILDRLNNWYKVRMSDTTEGWLPADLMVVI